MPVARHSHVTMLKLAKTRRTLNNGWPFVRRRRRANYAPLVCLLLVASMPIAMYCVPVLLWTYHIQRAGSLLDRALAWPEQRVADALPVLRDSDAANSALDQLHAAEQWRPDEATTNQRAAQVYAAQGKWTMAADALTDALRSRPNDPLIAWDLALMYERMLDQVRYAARENIIADLLSAPIEAPNTFINTTYCEAGRPATCYVAFERYSQPFASDPDGEATQFDSLVMFPPAAVKLEREINAGHPVLTFAMGLDPNMWSGKSDGASFEVWITPPDGVRQRVFVYDYPPAGAAKGWIPGHVDLSPWAGQTVTLELRTTGGQTGDTTDDWYTWGDVAMTTADAARINRHLVERRLRELWKSARLDTETFVARGDEQLRLGAAPAADIWYRRALLAGPQPTRAVQFRAQTAAAAHDGSTAGTMEHVVAAPAAGNRLTIPGPDLLWLSRTPAAAEVDGERLGALATPAPQIGALWWDGAAVLLVRAESGGRFRVTARSQHASPAAIELAIESNLQPVQTFSLGRGDWSWEDISADVTLHQGINVISIRIMNDGPVSGEDRNAFLELLQIDPLPAGGSG